MVRVCGALLERDALSARRCWCHGLFCGKGGGKLSVEFRRTFKNTTPASSRAQCDELM